MVGEKRSVRDTKKIDQRNPPRWFYDILLRPMSVPARILDRQNAPPWLLTIMKEGNIVVPTHARRISPPGSSSMIDYKAANSVEIFVDDMINIDTVPDKPDLSSACPITIRAHYAATVDKYMSLRERITNIVDKCQSFPPELDEATKSGIKNIDITENSQEYKIATGAVEPPVGDEPTKSQTQSPEVSKVFIKIQEILTMLRDTPSSCWGDASILADAKDVIASMSKNANKIAVQDPYDNIVIDTEADVNMSSSKRSSPDTPSSPTKLDVPSFDLVTPPVSPRKSLRIGDGGVPQTVPEESEEDETAPTAPDASAASATEASFVAAVPGASTGLLGAPPAAIPLSPDRQPDVTISSSSEDDVPLSSLARAKAKPLPLHSVKLSQSQQKRVKKKLKGSS